MRDRPGSTVQDRRRVSETSVTVAAAVISLAMMCVPAVGHAQSQDPSSPAVVAIPAPRPASEQCVPANIPFDAGHIALTGRWSADNKGMYYIRQVGDKVFWNGMSDFCPGRR